MNFEFFTPQRIIFGWGRKGDLKTIAPSLGKRALVVLGSRTLFNQGTYQSVADLLEKAGIETQLLVNLSREPEVADVDQLANQLRAMNAGEKDFVLALGGGSAIDLAKAACALATNIQSNTVLDFLEGVGRGFTVTQPPLKLLAMPTTGGTGTEATKNAVISSSQPAFKKSIRSPLMVPPVVLIDPELSVGVSPETTAATGMDAITQLIESYICRFAQPIPRALALEGLKLALPNLEEAVANGKSQKAREAMAYAALLSGICLANSGLGFAHGVAAALGIHAKVPHGLACAMMLPNALQVNFQVSKERLAKLNQISQENPTRGGGNVEEEALQFISTIENLCQKLNIPRRLYQVGVAGSQLETIAKASRGNSMNGNPRSLSDGEILEILERML